MIHGALSRHYGNKPPRPNFALNELRISSLTLVCLFTNLSMFISMSVALLLMRRVLQIPTLLQLLQHLHDLIKNPMNYHKIGQALLKRSNPSITEFSLVCFLIYFAFLVCLFTAVNVLIAINYIRALVWKFKSQ